MKDYKNKLNLKPLQIDNLIDECVRLSMNANAGLAVVKLDKSFQLMDKKLLNDEINRITIAAAKQIGELIKLHIEY